MAKNQPFNLASMKNERIALGMLVSLLGCVWLAAETGVVKTTLPIGPVVAIITGFAIFLPWIKK